MDVNTTITSTCDDYIKYLTVELLSGRLGPSFFNNDSWTDGCFSKQTSLPAATSLFNRLADTAGSITRTFPSTFNVSADVNSTHESNQDNFVSYLNHYICGYATMAIASIGSILNLVAVYLLSRRKGHKNMFNILLIVNMIFDTAYLATRLVHVYFMSLTIPLTSFYYTLKNSGERFTLITSVLILVALTHSRYQAATSPHNYRELTLFCSKRRNQLLKYLLPIFLVATCLTIPIIWEIDDKIVFSSEDITFRATPSEIRLNPYYHIFLIGFLNLVLLGVYPYISFLYYGYHIINTLNQKTIFTESSPNQRRRSSKASRTIFTIIFTFIILHSFRMTTNIGELIVLITKNKTSNHDLHDERGIPNWLQIIATLGEICMVVNTSVNYVVYHFLN